MPDTQRHCRTYDRDRKAFPYRDRSLDELRGIGSKTTSKIAHLDVVEPRWENDAAEAIREAQRLLQLSNLSACIERLNQRFADPNANLHWQMLTQDNQIDQEPEIEKGSQVDRIDSLLRDVYRLSSENKTHAAGDLIFDYVQGLLHAGNFGECSELLKAIKPSLLNPTLRLAFLSATLAAKQLLSPAREDYLEAVEAELTCERGSEKATRLLSGLR